MSAECLSDLVCGSKLSNMNMLNCRRAVGALGCGRAGSGESVRSVFKPGQRHFRGARKRDNLFDGRVRGEIRDPLRRPRP